MDLKLARVGQFAYRWGMRAPFPEIVRFSLTLLALGLAAAQSGCDSLSKDDPTRRTVTLMKWDLNRGSVTSAMTSDAPAGSVTRLVSYYMKARVSSERISSLKLVVRHSAYGSAKLTKAYDDRGRPLRTEVRNASHGSSPVANAVDSTLAQEKAMGYSFQELQITLDLNYVESRAHNGLETVIYGDNGYVIARIDPEYVIDFLDKVRQSTSAGALQG